MDTETTKTEPDFDAPATDAEPAAGEVSAEPDAGDAAEAAEATEPASEATTASTAEDQF